MSGAGGLAWCGAIAGWAALLTIGTFVVVGAHHKHSYDAWRDTMTDLGKGTDGVARLFIYVNLVVAVLLGVLAIAARDVLQSPWITRALIVAAAGSFIFGFTARRLSWLHNIAGGVVILAMIVAPSVFPWLDSQLQGNELTIFRWVSLALGIAALVLSVVMFQQFGAKRRADRAGRESRAVVGLFERLVWVAGYGWVVVLACTLVRPGWWCVLALGLWLALALRYVLWPDWRDPSPEFSIDECQPGTLTPLGNATYGLLWVGTIDTPEQFLRQLDSALTDDPPLIGKTGDGGTAAVTVAFTAAGLDALDVDYSWHAPFVEDAFGKGMRARAESLGDTDLNDPNHWDDGWDPPEKLHVAFWIQTGITDEEGGAARSERLDAATKEAAYLEARERAEAKLERLDDRVARQFTSVTERLRVATNRLGLTSQEHFGFVDGLSQPWIEGVPNGHGAGGGKRGPRGGWKPLALGEFVVGQVDETGDIFPVPDPPEVFLGGTFLVVRKLEQDVAGFRSYAGADDGTNDLAARLIGRKRNGAPLELGEDASEPNDFTYGDDPEGRHCPLGAHIRRSNPRDALGFGSTLTARRRIIRRGMPYGERYDAARGQTQRGLLFLAYNVRIAEQFEFVQKQWLNDASPFGLGNIPDPASGLWPPGSPRPLVVTGEYPTVCADLRSFVTTKGGEYFFVPSVPGLRFLARLTPEPRRTD